MLELVQQLDEAGSLLDAELPDTVSATTRRGRTLNMMATERDTTLQAVLGEAIDLWLRENGKHPFGER